MAYMKDKEQMYNFPAFFLAQQYLSVFSCIWNTACLHAAPSLVLYLHNQPFLERSGAEMGTISTLATP